MEIIEKTANFLGLPINSIIEISQKSPKTYKLYKIPKKRDGYRLIHHPSSETKSLQYSLIEVCLSKFPGEKHPPMLYRPILTLW